MRVNERECLRSGGRPSPSRREERRSIGSLSHGETGGAAIGLATLLAGIGADVLTFLLSQLPRIESHLARMLEKATRSREASQERARRGKCERDEVAKAQAEVAPAEIDRVSKADQAQLLPQRVPTTGAGRKTFFRCVRCGKVASSAEAVVSGTKVRCPYCANVWRFQEWRAGEAGSTRFKVGAAPEHAACVGLLLSERRAEGGHGQLSRLGEVASNATPERRRRLPGIVASASIAASVGVIAFGVTVGKYRQDSPRALPSPAGPHASFTPDNGSSQASSHEVAGDKPVQLAKKDRREAGSSASAFDGSIAVNSETGKASRADVQRLFGESLEWPLHSRNMASSDSYSLPAAPSSPSRSHGYELQQGLRQRAEQEAAYEADMMMRRFQQQRINEGFAY